MADTTAEASMTFNPEFFKTKPGVLKIAQMVLSLLCLILSSPVLDGRSGFFVFALIYCLIFAICFAVLHALSLTAVLVPVNWHMTELINNGILMVCLAIGAVIHIVVWFNFVGSHSYFGQNLAAGVFGLLTVAALVMSFLDLYRNR